MEVDKLTALVVVLPGALDAGGLVLPPKLAQAKLILVTDPPVDLGLLKSHTISTYGQHSLSVPMLTISPLTNAALSFTTPPTFTPALSTTWNPVPV